MTILSKTILIIKNGRHARDRGRRERRGLIGGRNRRHADSDVEYHLPIAPSPAIAWRGRQAAALLAWLCCVYAYLPGGLRRASYARRVCRP